MHSQQRVWMDDQSWYICFMNFHVTLHARTRACVYVCVCVCGGGGGGWGGVVSAYINDLKIGKYCLKTLCLVVI